MKSTMVKVTRTPRLFYSELSTHFGSRTSLRCHGGRSHLYSKRGAIPLKCAMRGLISYLSTNDHSLTIIGGHQQMNSGRSVPIQQ